MNKEYIKKEKRYEFTEQGLELVKNEILIKGNSYRQVAKILDINADTLSSLCKRYNIAKDNRRKYTVNENYFKNIDSKEKAYWLGFIAADGYVREDRGLLQIQLQEKDKNHLNKFLKAVESNKEIMKIEQNNFIGYRIYINSRKMINDLVILGCKQNKSLTLKPPNNIPKDLILYWILGYYDGDGGVCIYENGHRYKTYFTGTYEVVSFIKEYFHFTSSIRKEHRCENNTYSIHITETKSKEMLDMFYDKDTINFCLERKYNKYAHYIK